MTMAEHDRRLEQRVALAIRDALRHMEPAYHERSLRSVSERLTEDVMAALLDPEMLTRPAAYSSTTHAQAWREGYEAAQDMARRWGHTDSWESEPDNPYNSGACACRCTKHGLDTCECSCEIHALICPEHMDLCRGSGCCCADLHRPTSRAAGRKRSPTRNTEHAAHDEYLGDHLAGDCEDWPDETPLGRCRRCDHLDAHIDGCRHEFCTCGHRSPE